MLHLFFVCSKCVTYKYKKKRVKHIYLDERFIDETQDNSLTLFIFY